MQRISIIKKPAIISAVIVLFIFSCGGSANPLTWKSQFERRISPHMLIQPEKVGEFYKELDSDTDPHSIGEAIEEEIVYANDFVTYASLDHLPTAEEVLSSRKDDCDGQAVLLCSVLRYAGYDACVVIGPSHAWVEVEGDEPINYRGGNWFVKFNESFVEWKGTTLLLLVVEEFLLLTVFLSLAFYAYEKKIFTYLQEFLGYFKYVLLFFSGYILIGFFILVIRSTLWIVWLVVLLISFLLIIKLVSKIRTYFDRTSY